MTDQPDKTLVMHLTRPDGRAFWVRWDRDQLGSWGYVWAKDDRGQAVTLADIGPNVPGPETLPDLA